MESAFDGFLVVRLGYAVSGGVVLNGTLYVPLDSLVLL
jgi:hypothetical protein